MQGQGCQVVESFLQVSFNISWKKIAIFQYKPVNLEREYASTTELLTLESQDSLVVIVDIGDITALRIINVTDIPVVA